MDTTENLYSQHLMHNYGMPPVTFVSGKGSRVVDDQGKSYLDFCAGIAVNALGHGHPHWVKRVQEQAAKLVHVSNLYRNEPQAQLAEKLSQYTGKGGRFLFCNSGAEANEGLLKLARLHGKRKAGEEGKCYKVVVAENAFHGRTFGGMAATPQEKIQGGFRPMLDGFSVAKLNDIESFAAQVDENTAAIFIETIQGEGGINPATVDFLKALRKLCDDKDILLMLDEVQCGIGRTGTFFAFEQAGIQPDAIGMAKGIAGGFPMGAIWAGASCAELFQPGMHGTTFGGSPLACTAALAVLEVIESEGLLAKVQKQSAVWKKQLQAMADAYPDKIKGIRGAGYMVGIALTADNKAFSNALRENGLLAPPAGKDVVRLLPPLTASSAELKESIEFFTQTLKTN